MNTNKPYHLILQYHRLLKLSAFLTPITLIPIKYPQIIHSKKKFIKKAPLRLQRSRYSSIFLR